MVLEIPFHAKMGSIKDNNGMDLTEAEDIMDPILQMPKQTNGDGNGNPLQYSCLENPMDGEAW